MLMGMKGRGRGDKLIRRYTLTTFDEIAIWSLLHPPDSSHFVYCSACHIMM